MIHVPRMAQPDTYELQNMSEEGNAEHQPRPKSSERFEEPTLRAFSTASSRTVREPPPGSSVFLEYDSKPVLAFIFYATIALYAWIVFCITSRGPIGSKKSYFELDQYYEEKVISLLSNTRNHIRAAEILQSIATLLTIPITSAICAVAAVAFMQAGGLRTQLTLRQTAALADQGWLSPRILLKFSALGSLPLHIAFGLTVVGECGSSSRRQLQN